MNQGSKTLENEGFNRAIEYVGGKWKLQILSSLKNGPLRFTALKDSLSPITQKMLATALKELESDGLVHRQVFSVVPPRVEYSVTPLFGNLGEILELISSWGSNLPSKSELSISDTKKESTLLDTEFLEQSDLPKEIPIKEVAENENYSSSADVPEQVIEVEHPQKRESFLKKNEKTSKISNLFK